MFKKYRNNQIQKSTESTVSPKSSESPKGAKKSTESPQSTKILKSTQSPKKYCPKITKSQKSIESP